MPFATTKHLSLRAYRDGDKDTFLAQQNDQRVMRTLSADYVVPRAADAMKKYEKYIADDLVFLIIEVKKEYRNLRRWDEAEVRVEDGEKKEEDWDREMFVGHAAMWMKTAKNRDSMMAIGLTPQWFGNGFATEVIDWMVQHGFEQLNLHRISLSYLSHNPAARRVYEKCGFVQEAVQKKAIWSDGRWVDDVMMGIVDEEYWERKKRLTTHTI